WPPMFAYFVPMPWQLLFGLSPVYWPGKLYWSALAGDASYWIWLPLGLAWQALLIWLLLRRYHRVMRR
ncbi:MAG: ABC transporter, partial [Acidobacteriota bacterium]|nr:ABC transporter [Acidobacteriota bacterium]